MFQENFIMKSFHHFHKLKEEIFKNHPRMTNTFLNKTFHQKIAMIVIMILMELSSPFTCRVQVH